MTQSQTQLIRQHLEDGHAIKCGKCLTYNPIEDFNRCKKAKNGHQSYCKVCHTAYYKTKKGLIVEMYSGQKSRKKQRGVEPPNYSKEWFSEWLLSNPKFNEIYTAWVEGGYKTNLKPSVDRADDYQGYTKDNIQLMTWGENCTKAHKDMREGKIIHGYKPQRSVSQHTKKGSLIAEYHSISEAGRVTGVDVGNICACCAGKRYSSAGFIWRYA